MIRATFRQSTLLAANKSNVVPSSLFLRQTCSYAKPVLDLDAEALRIKMETKRLKELKEKKMKEMRTEREQRTKLKEKELEKKKRERALEKLAQDRIKKAKAIELDRVRRRKEKEALRGIELKQKQKLKNIAQSQKNKEKKHKSDPNAPKRPVLAFFWYNAEQYSKVQQQLAAETGSKPTLVQVAKVLRENFAKLDEDAKKKYYSLAEQDKYRYEREKAAYNKKKNAHWIGRPITPYMRFATEIHQQLKQEGSTLPVTERAKKIGAMWNALSQTEKQKYQDAYKSEMEVFNASKTD